MFETLMNTYHVKADVYRRRHEELAAKMEEQAARISLQTRLNQEIVDKKSNTSKQQSELLQKQRTLVLDRQSLELEQRALEALLGEQELPIMDDQNPPEAETLRTRIQAVKGALAEIEGQRRKGILETLAAQTRRLGKLSAAPTSVEGMNTGLLLQEHGLLDLTDRHLAKSGIPLSTNGCRTALDSLSELLARAKRLVQPLTDASDFLPPLTETQVAELQEQAVELEGFLKTWNQLDDDYEEAARIPSGERDERLRHLEERLREEASRMERSLRNIQTLTQDVLVKQARQGHLAAMSAQSVQRLAALLGMQEDERSKLPPRLQNLLSSPLSADIRSALAESSSYEQCATALGADAAMHLQALKPWADNHVAQGPFLLGADSELIQKKQGKKDTAFIKDSHAANGDYNDLKNLGKFIYHVTALSNLLDVTGLPDAGSVALQGLQPRQAGRRGGASLSAENEATVPNTTVSMRDASVINSQNKVAASSNRNEAMRVYVKQGEEGVKGHVEEANVAWQKVKAAKEQGLTDEEAEKTDAQASREAALRTPVMLRFPIRIEYLGKFDKDPVHMADNLRLLDGTPVPPQDIECLIHHQWVEIASEDFLAALKAMLTHR